MYWREHVLENILPGWQADSDGKNQDTGLADTTQLHRFFWCFESWKEKTHFSRLIQLLRKLAEDSPLPFVLRLISIIQMINLTDSGQCVLKWKRHFCLRSQCNISIFLKTIFFTCLNTEYICVCIYTYTHVIYSVGIHVYINHTYIIF